MERAVFQNAKASPKGSVFLSTQDAFAVALGIFGFFLGRVTVLSGVSPVAAGFVSNFVSVGPHFYVTAVFAMAGIATRIRDLALIKYAVSFGLIAGAHLFFSKKRYRLPLTVKAAVGGGAVCLSGLLYAVLVGFSPYFMVLALLEGTLTFFVTVVFRKAALIMGGTQQKKVLASEDMLSLAILLGAVMAGASDIHFGNIALRQFMAAWLILMVAYKGGGALGAAVGLLVGIMLYVVGFDDMAAVIAYATAGLCAGVFKNKDKPWVIGGFWAGMMAVTAYLSGVLLSRGALFSLGAGSLLFFLMPARFYFHINASIDPVIDNAQLYIDRVREITTDRLMAFSEAFARLARTFGGLCEKRTALNQQDVSRLIDDIANKTCADCDNITHCWEGQFYDTYQAVFGMLGACETRGRIEAKDIPANFRKTCLHMPEFMEAANKLYELAKVNLAWQNRMAESRELVKDQLAGVSGLIKDLAQELDLYVNFKEDLEATIRTELLNHKIEVSDVIVLENKAGKYEVTLTHKPCIGKKQCLSDIAPVVSKVLGRKMKPYSPECSTKKGNCTLRLLEEQRLHILSGVARVSKAGSKQSGDSYSFMELKNGQCMLALSDGMGSGNRAKAESAAAIGLLEDFIDSGFDKETAVKMINSALVLKGDEESFSTLDICAVNLYSGEAEFIKLGACPTYLLRNGAVSTIQAASLPVGILNAVELETCSKVLKDGDMLVMVTDGLTELPGEAGAKGGWIIEALCHFKGANPQDVADHLLDTAKALCNEQVQDDMTVLAARIWKKSGA